MHPTVWYNQGYSSLRDAVMLVRAGSGGRVRLAASHRDPLSPVLAAADVAFAEPEIDRHADPDAYVAWCLGTCRAHGVDLFIPQAGRVALARNRALFEAAGVRLAVAADPETLDLMEDKGRFYAAARAAGLPAPVAREIADVPGFDAAVADLTRQGLGPCVKPPVGVFGAGFWRLDESRSLFDQLMDPDARRIRASVFRQALAEAGPGRARLLVLQHLPGDEWSVDCLCDSGRLIAAVARRKSRSHQQLEVAGPAIDLARDTVAAFRLSGLVNVQSKAATEGGEDPHLLEVNPRMSGGCLYTAFSGVNLPWWQVALALGLAHERDIPAPTSPTVAPIGDAVVLGAGSGSTFSELVRT